MHISSHQTNGHYASDTFPFRFFLSKRLLEQDIGNVKSRKPCVKLIWLGNLIHLLHFDDLSSSGSLSDYKQQNGDVRRKRHYFVLTQLTLSLVCLQLEMFWKYLFAYLHLKIFKLSHIWSYLHLFCTTCETCVERNIWPRAIRGSATHAVCDTFCR